MGQCNWTDDQNPSNDSRDDTHDHGTDDETGVGVLATADTETARDDEENRAPYSSPVPNTPKSRLEENIKSAMLEKQAATPQRICIAPMIVAALDL